MKYMLVLFKNIITFGQTISSLISIMNDCYGDCGFILLHFSKAFKLYSMVFILLQTTLREKTNLDLFNVPNFEDSGKRISVASLYAMYAEEQNMST